MLNKKQIIARWIAVGVVCWIGIGVAIGVVGLVGWDRESNSGTFLTTTSFGLIQSDGTVAETTRIPHQPGTPYGWSLYVYPTGGFTRIREVFVLPEGGRFEPPSKSKSRELKVVEYTISADGREQTEVFEVTSRRSFTIVETYVVGADDPPGNYYITLQVNDIEVKRFEFEVAD